MKHATVVKIGLTFLLLACCCSAGWGADPLQLTSRAEKEVTTVKGGKQETKRIKAEKMVPGEVVLFTNHFKNSGTQQAENAAITNPVPKHMTYVGGSAFGEGAAITFSVDKGKTYDVPEKLFRTEKGNKRPARPEEYTHIKWSFKIVPPGKEGEVGFKARLK